MKDLLKSITDIMFNANFVEYSLDSQCSIYRGCLPVEIKGNTHLFEKIWQLHPDTYHRIYIRGKWVMTPRWQQAYGKDYFYTGNTNKSLPVPIIIEPFLSWAQKTISNELNGVLINWYDSLLKHYIGKHQDSTQNLRENSYIVTISLGEERIFRMRPIRGGSFYDISLTNGDVLVMPLITNQFWTHEVPFFKAYQSRRISITIREFY